MLILTNPSITCTYNRTKFLCSFSEIQGGFQLISIKYRKFPELYRFADKTLETLINVGFLLIKCPVR